MEMAGEMGQGQSEPLRIRGTGPDGVGHVAMGISFGHIKEARIFLLVLHGYQITKLWKLAGKSRTIWRTSFPYQRLRRRGRK